MLDFDVRPNTPDDPYRKRCLGLYCCPRPIHNRLSLDAMLTLVTIIHQTQTFETTLVAVDSNVAKIELVNGYTRAPG